MQGSRLMLATLSITFALNACRTQQPHVETHEDTSVASVAGCYELKLGRWWPWGFGEDNKFVTPANRIQLLLDRGTEGFEKGYYLIRPMKSASFGRGGVSYWFVGSNGQAALVWNDGFTGVTLEVQKHANELEGWAHPHFDAVPLIPRIATVTARPIACDPQ
jgi:hypothetical protein